MKNVLMTMVMVLICGCLYDNNDDGQYKIGVVADSNSVVAPDIRISWVTVVESSLPTVFAQKNGARTEEPLAWQNGALIGFSCVRPFNGQWGTVEAGVAWARQMVIYNAVDAIFLAVGTNDLEGDLATPEQVIQCYKDVKAVADEANLAFFVATTPPVYDPFPDAASWNVTIDALNELVRENFDPRFIVDFHNGFTPDMYLDTDGRHLNDIGEQLRAQRAQTVIEALE